MDEIFEEMEAKANKEGEFGFVAWLLIQATLKTLLSTGRISAEDLDGIFAEASKMYKAIPRIPDERFDNLMEMSSKIIKG